jgi:hypothetical protein
MSTIENKNTEDKNLGITLIIDKNQAMLLSIALGILPRDVSIENIHTLAKESTMGGLLGVTLMMLSQIIDKEEKANLMQALKNDTDYINPILDDIKQVSFTEYRSVCELAVESNAALLEYGDEDFEALLDIDKERYIKLNRLRKLFKTETDQE